MGSSTIKEALFAWNVEPVAESYGWFRHRRVKPRERRMNAVYSRNTSWASQAGSVYEQQFRLGGGR